MTSVGGEGTDGVTGELTHRRSGAGPPAGYGELLAGVKQEVRAARVQAARAVNTELIGLYWRIGRLLLDRRAAEGWGTAVVERLAADLRAEFPAMRGFSPRNLAYMRSLAQAYPTVEVLQQPAARLPWGHLLLLLDKVSDPVERDWYAAQAVGYGWSRAVLGHHLATQRYRRVGAAPNSFTAGVEPADSDSDLVRELATDPYDLDFLALEPGYSEHDLEDALVARPSSAPVSPSSDGSTGCPWAVKTSSSTCCSSTSGCGGTSCSNSKPAGLNPTMWASSASTSPSSMICCAAPSTATVRRSGSCSLPAATTSWSSTPCAGSPPTGCQHLHHPPGAAR